MSKYKQIKVTLNQNDYDTIKVDAIKNDSFSLSEYVRSKLFVNINDSRNIKKHKQKLSKSADPDLLYQINKRDQHPLHYLISNPMLY